MPGENIQDWSTTALDNDNADSLINWAEGMPRADVNNSARSMMAAHAKARNLQNGSIVTTGSANAHAFISGVGYTVTIPTGLVVRLKIGPGLTNTATATLNMDSIGAKAIKNQFGDDLVGGELRADSYKEFIYDGTNWRLSETTIIQNVLISNVTNIIATAVVDFTTGIDDSFDEFVFMISNLTPQTNSTILTLQVSIDGGVTWKSAAGDYRRVRSVTFSSSPEEFYSSSHAETAAQVSHTLSNVSTRAFAGEIRMYSPWRSGQINPIIWDGASWDGTDMNYSCGACVYFTAAGAVNAMRLQMTSGNIATGTISLYGMGKRA